MKTFKAISILVVLLTTNIGLAQTFKEFVYFDYDKFDLSLDAQKTIARIALKLTNSESYSVQIIGHTDTIGSFDYNSELSKKRAETVLNQFITNNILKEKLKIGGKSFIQPALPNSTDFNRAKNRRVEIIYTLNSKKTPKTQPIPVEIVEPPKKETTIPIKRDVVITASRGTQISLDSNAFAPYKLEDLKIEVTEVFEPEEMIKNNILTKTTNGQCLSSFGMVFIKVITKENKELTSTSSLIEIKIPAIKGIDKKVELYTATIKNGKTIWKLSKGKLVFDSLSEKQYYVFYTSTLQGFNMDKIIPCGVSNANIIVRKNTKSDVYIKNIEFNNVSLATKVSSKRYTFIRSNATQRVQISYCDSLSNKNYIVDKELASLKYNFFRNSFIVKKKDFVEAKL